MIVSKPDVLKACMCRESDKGATRDGSSGGISARARTANWNVYDVSVYSRARIVPVGPLYVRVTQGAAPIGAHTHPEPIR